LKSSKNNEINSSIGIGLYNGMESSEIVRLATKAEKDGFDSIWISEDPYLRDIIPLTALMASATTNAKIGTGILNIYTKHPVYLAMAAATLDEISHGRLTVGIGRGVRSLIQNELHIHYGSYYDYTEEYLICLRKLLSGEEASYEGREIKITGAKLRVFPKEHRIPILLGAIGPRMLELAGSRADGAILNSCSSIKHAKLASEQLEAGWKKNLQKRSGPDQLQKPELAASLLLCIDDDLDKAFQSAKTSIAFVLSIPGFGEIYSKINKLPSNLIEELRTAFRWNIDVGDPTWHLENAHLSKIDQLITDEIVDLLAICGSVENCKERIAEYFKAGVTTAILNPINPETFEKLPSLLTLHE